MTSEGREYGRRKREGSDEDEETDRIERESIDEVRREQESEESSEPKELPEQVYNPEQCVREAIEEIQQEEAERLSLEAQKESKEKPQESKEKGEISEEWDVDECVREIIEEVQQEEAERLKAQEEREHAEMETEQQLEASYESRKETADKDEFVELEERILEGFDEYGIDPEEVKEHWRTKFEEEVQDELGEKSRIQTEGDDDETSGQERTAEGHYYYNDGSGQIYEVQMESKESSGSETESCNEVQEVQEKVHSESEYYENSEPKREDVTPPQETENASEQLPKKREELEQKEATKDESADVEQTQEKVTKEPSHESSEYHDSDIKEDTPEIRSTPEKRGNQSEESISTSESDTKPKVTETREQKESENSQDAEEKVEEEVETREEEIWNNYAIEHESLEDEAYRRYLREVFDQLPKEEQERFREYVRAQVQTMEDFEELARRHGLDELLDDEDIMEEVRKYLELKNRVESDSGIDIELLAEELEIDVELAREWSRGESEPYSLKKLLNLEAFYLWDEVIRSYRELNLPRTIEELDRVLETNPELGLGRFFILERDDAVAWIAISDMRRRGEIRRKIRNGREVYDRKQIEELSKKYGISMGEIVRYLRSEDLPQLIRNIWKKELKRKKHEVTSFDAGGLIGTRDAFEQVLSRDQSIRLDKRFETWYRDVVIYFKVEEKLANGESTLEELAQEHEISERKLRDMRRERPYLLNRLERNELRRIYAQVNGGLPVVPIESMEDLKRLLNLHDGLRLDNFDDCETYFEMRRLKAQGWTYTQLSKKFKMSRASINHWLNDFPPKPIPKLREAEEERLIQNWIQEQALRMKIIVDNVQEHNRKIRGVILPTKESVTNLDVLREAVRYLASQIDTSAERILYANLNNSDEEQFLENRMELERIANEILGDESNAHLVLADNRLYLWVPNEYPFRLINLYSDLYFYFSDAASYAGFLNEVREALHRTCSQIIDETQEHLDRIISQVFPEERQGLKTRKGRRKYRIKGKFLHLLLDVLGTELKTLEGRISRVTDAAGYGGIENPRFPTGERLASVLARLYTTIGCDGNIKKNRVVGYWEEQLERIERVAKNLRELGDIDIKPRLEKNRLYRCSMPMITGMILNAMGLQSGNKTKHNPKLSKEFLDNMSWNNSRDFTADTIPEDGSINLRKRAITCSHSVQLTSDIGQDEIDLIKSQGKKDGSRWRLPFGKLKKLRDSRDPMVAEAAKRLYKRVMANPSNQILDEKEIVEKLGVKLVISPISVHYHGKTGNVTVSWRWRTAGEREAMKLAIIAPPNDVRKRDILKRWLQENADESERMFKELESQGLNVQRWWIK